MVSSCLEVLGFGELMSPNKNKRQPIFPIVMVIFGVVLILGSVGWLVNTSRLAEAQRASLSAPVTSPRIPYPEVQRVSLGDSKAAFDLKQAVFIDTRGEPYFSQGHIPGAIALTDDEVVARQGELDPNAWIITYCT
jgi:3-mercaptopyruvate sulfurtransferase SseA